MGNEAEAAALGGRAVVAAVGTGAWAGLRRSLAAWFGGGDPRREQATLERLDRTRAELEAVGGVELALARGTHEARWQTRIQDHLDELDDDERERATAELAGMPAGDPVARRVVAADHLSVAAGGDVNVRAQGAGSVAAAVIGGDVSATHPPLPDAFQG
jgi:hypothetical protein